MFSKPEKIACALVRWFCVSRKGGTGGGGWGHPQGAVHMVAARLGFEKAMVGARRATPRPDCMESASRVTRNKVQSKLLTVICTRNFIVCD